jgi:UDP-N-acetylenolpyruvoylglucosamine reductase
VNLGGATAQDVRHLIDLVRRKVLEEHGVDLETEICMLGSSSG